MKRRSDAELVEILACVLTFWQDTPLLTPRQLYRVLAYPPEKRERVFRRLAWYASVTHRLSLWYESKRTRPSGVLDREWRAARDAWVKKARAVVVAKKKRRREVPPPPLSQRDRVRTIR